MKALIIGGRNQNKLNFAQSKYNFSEYFNGAEDNINDLSNYKVIYGLNHLVKRMIDKGMSDEEIKNIVFSCKYDIVISDEIGCAVVSIEKSDRRCVELTGRICCAFANEAESVVRVFCGLPQIIKGKL